MCGIAGFVSFQSSVQVGFLERASALLKHRGPDDEGYLLLTADKEIREAYGPDSVQSAVSTLAVPVESIRQEGFKAGFLHRRLAILNTGPDGHQPMSDLQRRVWISYNGEIYNYKSLRLELENLGCHFRTQSDTEVLLQAWITWGPDCLRKLDGMWAFSILDLRQNLFFAACDPAGIKPFYYRHDKSTFFFASEVKALAGKEQAILPEDHEVARFLAFGQSDETEKTLFQGVKRLLGGHQITINLDAPEEFVPRRWHCRHVNPDFDYHPSENRPHQVEEIRNLLLESLSLRLQSEVPLGICLSGGIDSSTVAGMVASLNRDKKLQFPAKAFMATLPPGMQPDESSFARLMAQKSGLEFCQVCPGPADFLEALPDMMYALDAPPPGMNAYSQYAVFRMVSEHGVKVTLDGQGADEIFAGYPAHLDAGLWEGLQRGQFSGLPLPHFRAMLEKQLRNFLPSSLEWSMLLKAKPEYAIFHQEILDKAGPKNKRIPPGLNEKMDWDFSSGILPFLLKAADRNSMRWSVESRMPFADSAGLVQCLFSIPGNAKLLGGISKSLLRELARPFVPAEILGRKDKVGFAAPNQAWLRELLISDYARSLPACEAYINGRELERWTKKFIENPDSMDSQILWRAYAFRIWYSIFF